MKTLRDQLKDYAAETAESCVHLRLDSGKDRTFSLGEIVRVLDAIERIGELGR